MEFPKIELKPALAQRLQTLQDKQKSQQQVIAMAQQNWERRGQELMAEGLKVWEEIAREYPNLDLDHVNYSLDADGKTLVPVAVKLI